MESEEVVARGDAIVAEVEKAIIGKRRLLRRVLAVVLAGGHVLLEDYPGLGKTLLASSFARALGLDFRRIQFTPDLLPGDITGGFVLNRASGTFELRRGPIFANIVLADEINRASPKTQAALLEAMQEYQVTLEGETMALVRPFVVLATQNPIEFEGVFPLPEAQLDRFMVKLSVGYPSAAEEQEILRRRGQRMQDEVAVAQVVEVGQLRQMQEFVEQVYVEPDVEKYIVALVTGTRADNRVAVGASPRGSLALMKLARAWAALDGRDFVLPDDVKTLARPVLAHRLVLQPDFWMKRQAAEDVVTSVVERVPVPVIGSRV
ncbi:MAG: MoxR family ATPase [Candidatus Promineifilaceae bacterium]|nr:MoxR family ATPase [Candidatus Promineifilaceae bacterium]